MARPSILEAQKTWSVGVGTVKHYDLELNVDLNCGELAEFLDYVMNTKEFRDEVSINESNEVSMIEWDKMKVSKNLNKRHERELSKCKYRCYLKINNGIRNHLCCSLKGGFMLKHWRCKIRSENYCLQRNNMSKIKTKTGFKRTEIFTERYCATHKHKDCIRIAPAYWNGTCDIKGCNRVASYGIKIWTNWKPTAGIIAKIQNIYEVNEKYKNKPTNKH